jgi:hypothetical protein
MRGRPKAKKAWSVDSLSPGVAHIAPLFETSESSLYLT